MDPGWFLGPRRRSEARRQPHMQQLQAVGTRLRVALIRVPANIITELKNTAIVVIKPVLVDPHHFGGDPDKTQHPDADPDSDFYLMRIQVQFRIFI